VRSAITLKKRSCEKRYCPRDYLTVNPVSTKLQMAMFPPKSDWLPPEHPFPDILDAEEIAIDVETRDPHLKERGPGWPTGNGEVVGYAIAVPGWKGYFPVNHVGGGNLDRRILNKWLKKVFESPADKIMHNAQYDLGWIKAMGFEVKGKIIDTMMTAALIDENRFSYSLNALCYEYLGKTKSEKTLVEAAREFGVDPKGEMYKLPAMYVGPYAEVDAEITLELWHYFKTLLNREELWEIWELETALLPCLVEMTMNGIKVDLDRAERTKQELIKREKGALKKLKDLTGIKVEIWAAASIAKAFDNAGLTYPKTEKGSPSFTKNFLNEHSSELAKLIVEARDLNKMQGTFIDSILRYVHKERIHSHINQVRSDDGGTVSGRISMNNPNLQQIPARHPELGPMIRSLFLPDKKYWCSIDFSQQEPRILTHYAKIYGDYQNVPMPGAPEFVTEYTENPDADFHSMVAEMADIPRKQAKTLNLGLMYGMGVKKMCVELGMDEDAAKSLIDQYHSRVPFVKMLTKGVQKKLDDPRSSGSIRSLKGRKCRFDLWEPATFEMHKALPREEAIAAHGPTTRLKRAYTYRALNRLVQASAADQVKASMLAVYQAGYTPMLQVHDELAFSVDTLEEAKKLEEIMINAIELVVPSKCDIELGPSWGEAKEIK
jgi:DNA polymerase I-like protein with 3'-5' exonuclease and polymerase domains